MLSGEGTMAMTLKDTELREATNLVNLVNSAGCFALAAS